MSGKRAGLKTKVQEENPKAVYIHCYAHTLQLGVRDTSRSVDVISDALDLTSEISELVKRSPKRNAQFKKLQTAGADVHENSIGIRTLCPIRYVFMIEA